MYPDNFTLEKLRYYRKSNGFTQKQIAEILNVDRSTYAYYESGKSMPSLDIVAKLLKIFKVDYSELFGAPVQSRPELSEGDKMYMTDLTGDEKKLISRFRIMMQSQQKALLAQLGVISEDDDDDDDDELSKTKIGFRFK